MNSRQPFFSIITPIYNGQEYIFNYINTLKKQTFKNWESIIIDDKSTDNTFKLIFENINDDKRFIITTQDKKKLVKGPYLARNKGLKKAKGKYICFLDVDDFWEPEKLQRHFDIIKENLKIKLIYGSYIRQNKNSKRQKIRRPLLIKGLRNTMQYTNVIPMLTTCVKREVINNISFKAINHEDYIFWLDIIEKLNDDEIYYDRKINTIYLIHDHSISSSKIKMIMWTWKIYRSRGFSRVKSLKLILIRFFIQIIVIIRENFIF